MATRLNYSGLVIAGIGFFLTRFTVTLAIDEDPLQFYLAGVVPLALGLGLAAFGIALTVADADGRLVRTTAIWCVIGAGSMLVLVVLTLVGSSPEGIADLSTVRSQTYLSNFLIGGSVGGTFTGLYAARNRRQRGELQQQTRRLQVLNRLLRHEVLNAVTVIRGYAGADDDGDLDAQATIEEYTDTIERTIEEVKYLTWSAGTSGTPEETADVVSAVTASAETVRERYPDAMVSIDAPAETLEVTADDRLEQVFTRLLENGIVHAGTETPAVDLSVATTATDVRISIHDDGPGLPAGQRALLERGEIEEFDDPGSGFGLNVVRLLVERYGGDVETAVDESGSTITVVLPRRRLDGGAIRSSTTSVAGVRPAIPELTVTLGASLVAGLVYGLVAMQLGGSIAFIGVYYGVQSTVVGWITHEFHSVVFGFVFAGFVSLAPTRYRTSLRGHVAIGVGWGVVLWAFAAGVVSPIWLRLLGISTTIPSVSGMLLVSHVVWGIVLGSLTALGYRSIVPWLVGLERSGLGLRRRP